MKKTENAKASECSTRLTSAANSEAGYSSDGGVGGGGGGAPARTGLNEHPYQKAPAAAPSEGGRGQRQQRLPAQSSSPFLKRLNHPAAGDASRFDPWTRSRSPNAAAPVSTNPPKLVRQIL